MERWLSGQKHLLCKYEDLLPAFMQKSWNDNEHACNIALGAGNRRTEIGGFLRLVTACLVEGSMSIPIPNK